jgi:prevent-host-death family protein
MTETKDAMATKLTATQLARTLSDVLNRVEYRGERFTIERNGRVVAVLEPAAPVKRATVADLIEIFNKYPEPDPELADILEAIQAEQEPLKMPEWPS